MELRFIYLILPVIQPVIHLVMNYPTIQWTVALAKSLQPQARNRGIHGVVTTLPWRSAEVVQDLRPATLQGWPGRPISIRRVRGQVFCWSWLDIQYMSLTRINPEKNNACIGMILLDMSIYTIHVIAYMWRFPKAWGYPQSSSILVGFPHVFPLPSSYWGTPIYGTPMYQQLQVLTFCYSWWTGGHSTWRHS